PGLRDRPSIPSSFSTAKQGARERSRQHLDSRFGHRDLVLDDERADRTIRGLELGTNRWFDTQHHARPCEQIAGRRTRGRYLRYLPVLQAYAMAPRQRASDRVTGALEDVRRSLPCVSQGLARRDVGDGRIEAGNRQLVGGLGILREAADHSRAHEVAAVAVD